MSILRLNVAVVASLLSSTSLSAASVEVEFDEVTNLAATVSPDGSEAILDVQGILWPVSMQGGEAAQITHPDLDPARAHWSPSGDLIALQADKGGTFDIWTMSPDGGNLKQLTDAPWDEREPEVSPDGTSIAFVSDRSGTYDVWSIDIASGELTQWTGYDILKTYVRLKPDFMKIAAGKAAEMGIPTYSHFLSPGAYLGLSGTTHLGVIERLDYSRIGTITGKTYADAGMSVMTSFFNTHRSFFGEDDIREDARVQALLPKTKRDALDEDVRGTDTPETSDYLARLQDNPETFAQIVEAGGRVVIGTDAPLDFVAIGLHSNLRGLADGPMTPFQILQTATTGAAAEVGVSDEIGTIEPGKLADLAIVSGRPEENVADLINVEMVMKGGKLYTIDELIAPFAGAAAASSDSTMRVSPDGD